MQGFSNGLFKPHECKDYNILSVELKIKSLPVELLRPGMYQPRKLFLPHVMKELAQSMSVTGGNFDPMIVRPIKHTQGYEIICGERRWRAAQMNQMQTVLCMIGDYSEQQAMYISAVDNLQRENLNPLEEAIAYELLTAANMTHEQVADRAGKTRSHVTNYLRLLGLPLAVRDLIAAGSLSYAQARPICGLSAPGLQVKIAKQAAAKGWTSKYVEAEVSKHKKTTRKAQIPIPAGDDVDVERFKRLIAEQVGCIVHIRKSELGKWQLALSVETLDELQGVAQKLGVNTDEL